MVRPTAIVTAATLFAAACTATPRPAPTGPAPSGDRSPDSASTVTVSLDDRQHDARSPETVCRRGPGRRAAFAVEYSVDRDRGLTSVQVVIPDVPREIRTGAFVALVSLGPLLDPTRHHVIEGRPGIAPAGRGTATVVRRGRSASVSVRGTTADGVRMRVHVRCGTVDEGAG